MVAVMSSPTLRPTSTRDKRAGRTLGPHIRHAQVRSGCTAVTLLTREGALGALGGDAGGWWLWWWLLGISCATLHKAGQPAGTGGSRRAALING
jgi:hypothetical protein